MMNTLSRKIGDTSVPAIGFGAMGLSLDAYGPIETDEDRFKVLDAAHALGCIHWDTAGVYGDSEELLGKWFKRTGKRDDIFLATKCGVTATGLRGDPETLREHLNTSLQKFGVETIDLLYVHRVDPNTPVEVTIGALAEHVKAGKLRYIGLSECSAKTLRRAHAIHPIAAVQVEFSPLALEITDPKIGLLAAARELGVAIVVYAPLARGLLTGQFKSYDELKDTDFRRTVPRFSEENFPKILDVVSRIKEIGESHNATPAQVTLAWILAQGEDFHIIPGTRNIKYLNENKDVAALKLTREDIAAVQQLADEAVINIPGDRYGPYYMEHAYGDTVELK